MSSEGLCWFEAYTGTGPRGIFGEIKMEPSQENDIVARVLKGEREAYALLVDAYKTPIFNLAYRMTGSYEDAHDLAQETFIRAYLNLKKFHQDRRFFTWPYTIALNLIRNHLRNRRRNVADAPEETVHKAGARDDERIERDLIQAQKIDHLEICLQKLSADLREAVILRFYQELSFEEIAAISDASVSAVKMRVYRGIERLKHLMGEDKM